MQHDENSRLYCSGTDCLRIRRLSSALADRRTALDSNKADRLLRAIGYTSSAGLPREKKLGSLSCKR